MWQTIADVWSWLGAWLKNHEWLAVWLEGLALILLFGLERRQFKHERKKSEQSNKDTLDQLEITKQQAAAALLAAQSVANSERAWLTVDFQWRHAGNIVISDSAVGEQRVTQTCIDFVLTVTNDGKTPAWIETIMSSMEISGREKQPGRILTEYIPAIGAGKYSDITLRLCCPGKLQGTQDDQLAVHIKINYRDIFESHVVPLEFFVNPQNFQISRMEKVTVDFRPLS
jgi:hypothetical protein